uniref:Uncharacterized protein n=1 Tax=Lactuca sativa TaxID=4236 RepID=A0A9R1WR77_LACSA|nr:hypothetical protein LSAT_V11C900498970 [Lactuca sativa]
MYPWGILIWDFTYKQMCIVFDKIEDHLNPNVSRRGSRHTYTLQGFVYAFMTFPNNSIVGPPILGVTPQAIANSMMRRLHVPDCQRILDVTHQKQVYPSEQHFVEYYDLIQTSLRVF